LTPGIANSFSLAYCSKSLRAEPVTTPGFTVAGRFGKVFVAVADMLTTRRRLPKLPVKASTPASMAIATQINDRVGAMLNEARLAGS